LVIEGGNEIMPVITILDEMSPGGALSVDFAAIVPALPETYTVARPGRDPEPRFELLASQGALATCRYEATADVWLLCNEASGVIEIHDPRLFRHGYEVFCRAVAQVAQAKHQARQVAINLSSCTCRLEFGPGRFDRTELARRAAEAISAATPALGCPAPERPEKPREAVSETSRVADMALAGGSLALAVAGAILPGIPSLPFVILAARHAARVSPQFDRFLRRQPWAAALLESMDNPAGVLRLDAKCVIKMLLITLLAVAAFLVVHPPLPLVIGIEVAVMAVLCLRALDAGGLAELVA
jgi:uncharacterized protein